MRTATVTTVLSAPQPAVFEYMADIENLPEWATEFARELRRDGDDYKVVNGLGEFFFTIAADRASGVIDMFAGPTKEQMAIFPSRAVAPAGRAHGVQLHDVPGPGRARRAVRRPARVAAARVPQYRACPRLARNVDREVGIYRRREGQHRQRQPVREHGQPHAPPLREMRGERRLSVTWRCAASSSSPLRVEA